ncbi:MAG: enoyl-CoA hydratase [Hyphomonadaceae bacterium]
MTSPLPESLDSGTPNLLAWIEPPIGWLVFNNPERRNAIGLEMWAAIPAVMHAFANDPRVAVTVLRGEGGQAFASGADISQFETERGSAEANENYKRTSGAGAQAIKTFPKPSIAMISGFCIGGGLAVALSCDLRIATLDSRFGIPAARLGLGYAYGGVENLAHIVGPSHAKEILFTARVFDADDALRMGVINRAVPRDDLEATVRDYAGMIGANAPLTVRAAKLAVDAFTTDPARRDIAAVDLAVEACFASDDYIEGRRAFMEKRKAQFKGR